MDGDDMRMKVRYIVASGCGCSRDCEEHGAEWEVHCGCVEDADEIVALVAPAAAAAEREACAQIGDASAKTLTFLPGLRDVATDIAAAIRSRNTSSGPGKLGCASEGGVLAPSSDNPNT